MKLPATGTCQCGETTYRVTGEPLVTIACHCRDCQKLSASAFSLSVLLRRGDFELLSGELKSWERPTDAGGVAVCWLCPTCGNRVYHENPAMPDIIRLKPGALEDTSELQPQAHVWTCRQQAWLESFRDLPKFDRQPDMAAAMAAMARGESPFQAK